MLVYNCFLWLFWLCKLKSIKPYFSNNTANANHICVGVKGQWHCVLLFVIRARVTLWQMFNFPRPVSLMILMHASITEFDTNWVSRDHYREIPASTAVVACKGRVHTADKYNILSDSSKYLILKNIFIIEPFEHIIIQFMRQNLTISFLDILMIFLE